MYERCISLSSLMLQKKGICRSISYENPCGEKGKAAWTSSVLGSSRKGTPFLLDLSAGEIFTLADIEGTGIIRQFFITVTDQREAGPGVLQKLILRMYWENETEPSVECPLGEFFCCGHNEIMMLATEAVAVVPARSFHWYFPMAFQRHARLTLENTYGAAISVVAYQVTYTVEEAEGQEHSMETAHFHASYINCCRKSGEEVELTTIGDIINVKSRECVNVSCGKTKNSGLYAGIYLSARQYGRKCREEFLLCLDDGDGNVWYEPVDADQLENGGWHSLRIHNAVRYGGALKISLIPWIREEREVLSVSSDVSHSGQVVISGVVYWYSHE